MNRLERDLGIATETLALFVRYFLTVTPPLPNTDQDAARALGRERFDASSPSSDAGSPAASA